ncbi:hypothetical protein QYE76_052029 [Lolium multiflorum]|uniref:F-box domain-containing protein n=1 Tax=Lolium multiflorum TaxID=4521 RepID=A0AAD8SUH8_LOLMU|nr:hypothetical protein QYE76_052023 [Lolium multiflorum]KAK1663870.1 hypothetical protein QYE76_052029 [Lolium multiflorum]
MSESEGAELSRRRRRGSSPAAFTSLPDDEGMLREILLRLPPHPSSLPRASAVCKRWRRLVTDPKFIARFRAHHRKRPLLGVFQHGSQDIVFTPILDPPDRIPPRRFNLRICDGRGYLGAQLLGCRHGRVLAIDQVRAEVVLFDPITGEQRRLPVPFPPGFQIGTVRYLNGAVVCAAGDQSHVHGSCHSSPFKVVLVFMDSPDGRPCACVYSSETRMWGDPISADAPSPVSCGGSASILIGNVLYWPLNMMDDILEFDLDSQRLDVIKGPPGMDATQRHQIIQAEDGALGIALFTGTAITGGGAEMLHDS